MTVPELLELVVKEEFNDVSVQIRLQRIENGFLVRAGKTPVFYPEIKDAADAIRTALLNTKWPGADNVNQ